MDKKQKTIIIIAVVLLVLIIVGVILFFVLKGGSGQGGMFGGNQAAQLQYEETTAGGTILQNTGERIRGFLGGVKQRVAPVGQVLRSGDGLVTRVTEKGANTATRLLDSMFTDKGMFDGKIRGIFRK